MSRPVLVVWAILLGAVFLTPMVVLVDDPGDFLTRWTIRLALLGYGVGAWAMLRLSPQEWRGGTPWGNVARSAWTLGCATYVVHVCLAFHYFHHWSHAEAVQHVESRSGFGPGIYFSYLFTLLWIVDVVHWWSRPLAHATRSRRIGTAVHFYMAFIVFNATVVYETGIIRAGGLLLFAVLGLSLIGRKSEMRTSSLVVLLLLPLVAPSQTPEQKHATIAYLQSLQTKDSGFLPAHGAKAPSLRGTSAALRALKYFGGKAKNIDGCKKFVLSCWDKKNGGCADTPGGKPDVILTSVGLMALVELKIPTEPYEKGAIAFMAKNATQFEEVRMAAAGLEAIHSSGPKNEAWLKDLAARQNSDGTFGKGRGLVRDTGSAVACVLRLGGKVKDSRAVVSALDAGQRDDGGFGKADAKTSDLETSYRVVRTYHMLKSKPRNADGLKAFIAKCRNADGGYGVVPGATSSIGGTYFAGIILHWLDTK